MKKRKGFLPNQLSIAIIGATTISNAPNTIAAATIEEVFVTATRRAVGVQDIPYNITAQTGDSLTKLNIQDTSDLVRVIPGLSVIDTGARNANILSIRGLNATGLDANDIPIQSVTVSTYIDETPLQIDLKIIDLERIEVLRGPQGTLFGAGAMGGTIRYILNKPDPSELAGIAHARIDVTDESDGISYDTDLILNVPLNNKVAVRTVLGKTDKKGFIDYVNVNGRSTNITGTTVEDVNNEELNSARLAVRWLPSDTLDIIGSVFFQDQDVGGRQVANQPFTNNKYSNSLQSVEPRQRENLLLSLNVTWNLGFAELTSATAKSELEEDGSRDQSGLLINLDYGYEDFPDFRAFTADTTDEEIITQELRLVSTNDYKLQWIVGFFYLESEHFDDSMEFTPGYSQFIGVNRPDDLEFVSQTDEDIEETAIYAELSYPISNQWQVTGGLRYFQLDQQRTECQAFPLLDATLAPGNTTAINLSCTSSAPTDISETFFKFNTSYNINENIMTYFTVSEGFRRGGGNAVPVGGQVNILESERSFDPDRVTNYEVGVRSTLLNKRMTLNSAIFYVDWENIQLRSATQDGAIPIFVNAGNAESQGVEIEVSFAATDRLTMGGGFSYSDANLVENATGTITGFNGDALPGVPDTQVNLAADYKLPVSFGGHINFHIDGSYSSDVSSQLSRTDPLYEELGSYTIINAAMQWEHEQWGAALFVENLTKEYAELGLRNYQRVQASVAEFKYVNRPRTIGLDVRYYF